MLEKPISPLRQRMIDDMTARRFKEKVQRDYVRHVRNVRGLPRPFARHRHERGPSPLSAASWRSSRSAQGPSTPPSPRCGSSST